jgi:hypothetical protein
MPQLSVTKNYSNGEVFTEDMLDAAFDSIETFFNTTKIDGSNIQAGAVGTSQLAALAITTSKIANDAVTADKLADSASTDADRAVTTDHIRDEAITSAKIAPGAITKASLASLGQQLSSSSGAFSTSSAGSYVDVTNLSVTITTGGRPIQLALISDGSGNQAYLASGILQFVRGSTGIADTFVASANIPVSAFSHVDVPSAGTYTYKVQLRGQSTGYCYYAKLLAFEL